jgi:phosphopantetheinyl transferase (holo-ACP synthase)
VIGNDIVDLALARKESNWKRNGFLDKIFTKEEQWLITESGNPEIMVWNLWSRKEAVYKIYNRQTGIRGYFPIQIVCLYESSTFGTVSIDGNIYYTQTEILNDMIHTIAVVKREFFNQIKEVNPEIKIYKINGIPFVLGNQKKGLNPVSISHHGRFRECITL